uniref:Peptidase M15A C-terminal domain-containing protein n=1 Tax=uncultured prokaryote TaxID=198431 RepID=A0A0H5Q6W8_9ZZZZ|nr:hypothetical protein [uncultured prokaryote]
MGDLSTNFSRHEFQSKDGATLPKDYPTRELVGRLEGLRAIVGSPMTILSGHRSYDHNRAVGGATKSEHLYGRAADLEDGYATVDQAAAAGFRGIGEKDGYATHVDVRAIPARWSY